MNNKKQNIRMPGRKFPAVLASSNAAAVAFSCLARRCAANGAGLPLMRINASGFLWLHGVYITAWLHDNTRRKFHPALGPPSPCFSLIWYKLNPTSAPEMGERLVS